MTGFRDLAWQQLDATYRSSAAHHLARYALALNYESLPADVVHQAKRCMLDTMGVAIGAWDAPGRPMIARTVSKLGGPAESTLFGSGLRVGAPNATLFNSFLVHFLEYNDLGGGSHNSDAIPGLLAVAEQRKAGGCSLLTSIVISYELGARITQSVVGANLASRGWGTEVRGGLSMPPSLGRIMGLTEAQIAHAIGVCTSHALPLYITDANREEYCMAKNLRFGWVVHDAILSCMMAEEGFTGPLRIVEGDSGFSQVLLQGQMDLERLFDFSGWRILNTRHKSLCLNVSTQGHVYATIAIVKENDLKPEDIASVRIKACLRDVKHTASLAKKYPRNAETADHSGYYANAFAIKHRSFGPEAFAPENFTDPVIEELTEKITIEVDPTLPDSSLTGTSEIITRDGRRFQKRVDTPHGQGDDPLTDRELEDKFSSMAEKRMGKAQIAKIFDTIWNFEKKADVHELTKLMVFAGK